LIIRSGHEAIEFINDDRLNPQNKTAAVNRKNRNNQTTLTLAAFLGTPLTLIQQPCEIGSRPLIIAQNNGGRTALLWASLHPNLQVVTHLVQNGGKELLNKQKNMHGYGYTALHKASFPDNQNLQVVMDLVEHGGGKELVNKRNKGGNTA